MQLTVLAATAICAAEPTADLVPTKGLVAYYPFSGGSKDASGNGSHVSAKGAMLADDKFGNTRSAYYFDGRKDYMVAPVCIIPSVMPRVTIAVWARSEQKDQIATVLSNASGHLTGRSLSMRHSPGKGGCWATSTSTDGSWVWQKVEVGKWTFLAVSYDQSAKKLYLHVNDRKYEANCSRTEGNIDLTIGKNPHLGQYFHGCLDEIRVYDRILNDDEIAVLYRQFQHEEQPGGNQAFSPDDGRRGVLLVFIAGFSLFAGIVIAANIMIRKKTRAV